MTVEESDEVVVERLRARRAELLGYLAETQVRDRKLREEIGRVTRSIELKVQGQLQFGETI